MDSSKKANLQRYLTYLIFHALPFFPFLQTAPGEGRESGGVAAMPPSLGSPEGRFEDAQVGGSVLRGGVG